MADNGYRGSASTSPHAAVVAGEDNGGPWRHMERSVSTVQRHMQIESLWVFNKKYGPSGVPATSSPTRRATRRVPDLPSPAEAVTELPFVGRLLNARVTRTSGSYSRAPAWMSPWPSPRVAALVGARRRAVGVNRHRRARTAPVLIGVNVSSVSVGSSG